MVEWGCVISHLSSRVSVRLCGAHSYGMEMLPVLRRFPHMFRELKTQYGPGLTAPYQAALHEARVLLGQVDGRESGSATRSRRHGCGSRYTICDDLTAALHDSDPPGKRTDEKACLTPAFRLWFRPAEDLQKWHGWAVEMRNS
jgi:hypothetical protein